MPMACLPNHSICSRVLSEDEITQNFEATDSGLAVSPAGKLAVAWGKIKL